MNKKLISIAVAAAMAAPLAVSADTTLYGRINNSVMMTDVDLTAKYEGEKYKRSSDQWDVEDYASRLGVKGSEDLGNGMKAIYQIELQMETADGGATSRPRDGAEIDQGRLVIPGDDFGTRLGYVGVSSGWGTVAVGRQWTPYYGSVDKTDIFQTAGSNQAYIGLTRVGDAVAYVSPAMGGFTVSGAMLMSNGSWDTGSDSVDIWNVSADWNAGPFSVGASYVSAEGDANVDQWGIGASWKIGDMFALIGQYEDGDLIADDADSYAVAGQFFFGNNTISAKYGETDGAGGDVEEWILQWEHFLSKRTRVFAIWDSSEWTTTASFDELDSPVKANSDSNRYGIGIRHDF